MYHFEEAPPPSAWSAISARLEDDDNAQAFAQRLQAVSFAPPTDSWQQIAARLDDDQQYRQLSVKMQSAAEAPPPAAWQHILASLNNDEKSAIAPISKRPIVYRMAAAAVVAALLFGLWLLKDFSGNNQLSIDISGALLQAPAAGTAPSIPRPNVEPQTNNSVHDQNTGAATVSAQRGFTTGTAGSHPGRPLKYAVVSDIYTSPETSIVISSPPIVDQYGQVIRDLEVLTTQSSYLSIMGPNGETTRISSKFANAIRYLNGNTEEPVEYLDNVIRDSDTWKKRFQEWRSKISQSSFVPSTSNFLDILSFKDLLQQNN